MDRAPNPETSDTSLVTTTPDQPVVAGKEGERGAIGIALLVWLLGGGLGLAVLVFILAKVF